MLQFLLMEPAPRPAAGVENAAKESDRANSLLYCPVCSVEVSDPLTCGDCSAVICRRCGTPLESPDELGIG
jgi:hypothetical protein